MPALRLSIDPSGMETGAQKAESALDRVTREAGEAEGAVDRFSAGMKTAGKSSDIMAAGATKAAASNKRLTSATQAAANQMGGNGGFAHQSRMAAMQLSQVAQQTAATGDFVRALAIQLPDLALGFGAVGIGIGVVAGAVLPMAANLITGRDNATELENAMDSLSQASRDYISAADQAKMSVSELALEFGSAAEEAKRAFEFMQGVSLGKALDQLTVALGTMDFSELERLASIVQEGPAELEVLSDTYNKALAGLQEQFGVTGEQALKLRDRLNEIRTASGPEEIVQAVDRLNQYLVASFGSAQDIPPELREMVQRLLEAQTAAARITARLDGSADSANTAANAASNLSGQLSVAAQYAGQLAANLAMAPAGIQGFQNKAEQLTAQISALDAGLGQITASAAGYRKELEQKYGLADAANDAEANYISGVINRQVDEYTNVQNLNKAYTDRITAINKVETASASASKKAASASQKAAKAAVREINETKDAYDSLMASLDPVVAATQRFDDAQETVNAAMKAGHITSTEAAEAYDLARERFDEAVASADKGASVWDGFGDSARNAFGAIITGAESAKDAVSSLLSSLAGKLANSAFDGLFGGIGGSSGSGGLFGGSIIPGILHSGGIAGQDGYGHGRSVSPAVFAGATRYHNGGIAGMPGLKPNEVPAILERGERVIPKGQSGGDGGYTYAPVYNIDARGTDDAGALNRIRQGIAKIDAEFEARAVNAYNMGKKRRQIV